VHFENGPFASELYLCWLT